MKLSVFILSILFLLIGCSDDGIETTESGIEYKDHVVGEGEEVKEGDVASIHFIGWIVQDSTNLFSDWETDSTKQHYSIGTSKFRKEPLKVIIGDDEFIAGSDEGIIGMKVGGKRTIIIPSELAYGKEGKGPIPPDTDIKLDIELLGISKLVKVEMWDVDSSKLNTTESGLQFAIVEEGDGIEADSGQIVTVHYSGFFEDGRMFDSSVRRGEPFRFLLGSGSVIPGWEEGLDLLKKGSKARLVIPPQLAYGEAGNERIPPNTTLYFDVELVDVE